ncbi:MAG: acetate--CoA ligase family protein [Burkholderiales bacterium]|nr:acetate--CoA ligase family protein [Burkholderiales bacterium]
MMLLEHEGKALLAEAGVPVPAGVLLDPAPESLAAACARITGYPVAVKAQVRAGGRGRRGGVRKVDAAHELAPAARRLFDMTFAGERPQALLVEPWLGAARETYLSVAVDGLADGYVVLYAPAGGVDIEDGSGVVRHAVGTPWNFRAHAMREALERAEPDYQWREKVLALAQRLLRLAAARDCTTIEINPLARLADGSPVAIDAKVVRDEWAHFRNSDIRAAREAEQAAAERLLRDCLEMGHMYVRLDGDVGLISGGAGMTMAAMDMIAEHGGRPACFLDCSPGPTSARGYRPAFAMLDADPSVKCILVSIFGGGTQMQRVANAMKEVMAERHGDKPVVFRLDGTNVDQVAAIFAGCGAHNHARLEDAVAEAVRLAAGRA